MEGRLFSSFVKYEKRSHILTVKKRKKHAIGVPLLGRNDGNYELCLSRL